MFRGSNLYVLLFIVAICFDSVFLNVVIPSDLKTIRPVKNPNVDISHRNLLKDLDTLSVITKQMITMHNATVIHTHVNTTTHSNKETSGGHNQSNHNTNSTNNNSHDQNNNGEHGGGSSSGGGHHVAPPSFQLHPNLYNYKPENFKIFQEQIAIKQIMVGFMYPHDTHYDRYIFQIRYHGYETYTTNKLKLNRTEVNFIILKEFADAQYVICVALFSSSGVPEYRPLSTSDMCIDITIGPAHAPGGHHTKTGLLTPLLVVVAAVLLFIIAVGDCILHSCDKKREKKKLKERRISRINQKQAEIASAMHLQAEIPKSWQTAAHKTRLVENDSQFQLDNNKNTHQYTNRAFAADISPPKIMITKSNSEISARNLTSLQTINHLLEDKPWVVNQQKSNNF